MEQESKELKKTVRKELLNVSFDEENNTYHVFIPSGSSVSETAFCVHVLIKCLIKDGVIEKSEEFINLVNKYLGDIQYEELKNDI